MCPWAGEGAVTETARDAGPVFAIIVVTYQRDEALERALEAIVAQTVGREQMEVCVVANSPSPGARARFGDAVDVWIDTEENLGASAGRNLGVKATSAPLMVFIDDDSIPEPDFVRRLGAVMRRDADVIAVRGRAAPLSHPVLSYAAAHYSRGPRECKDLLTLEGCACIRRVAYDAVGGYDIRRFHYAGLELSGRLLKRFPDSRMLYCPDAVIRHDFFKGPRHFLQKARMGADADDLEQDVRSEDVERARRALRSYEQLDGRTPAQRAIGVAITKVFRATVAGIRLSRRFFPP